MLLASYQADDRLYAYHVRFDGDRVIWRIPVVLPFGEPGRWRDHPLDERVIFQLHEGDVLITIAEA